MCASRDRASGGKHATLLALDDHAALSCTILHYAALCCTMLHYAALQSQIIMDDSLVITALPSWPVVFFCTFQTSDRDPPNSRISAENENRTNVTTLQQKPFGKRQASEDIGFDMFQLAKGVSRNLRSNSRSAMGGSWNFGLLRDRKLHRIVCEATSSVWDPFFFGRFESFPHNNFVLKLMNCLFMQSGETIYPCHT